MMCNILTVRLAEEKGNKKFGDKQLSLSPTKKNKTIIVYINKYETNRNTIYKYQLILLFLYISVYKIMAITAKTYKVGWV